ncbi:MAG TPA: hypothetical protein VIK89_07360, partial [Cytophagaceae bacterium]
VYNYGVNVYRREAGQTEWIKLNSVPVKKNLPDKSLEDRELDFFVKLMREVKKEELKGILLLNVLVKTFESPDFSNYLGILYKDDEVESGKIVEYKVTELVAGGEEKTIGYSNKIQVQSYKKESPVTEVVVKQKSKKVVISWKPEDERFYSVNIYRTNVSTSITEKVNANPVVVSKIKDSTGAEKYPEVMFEDLDLEEGETYVYTIAGMDFWGDETEHSEKVTVAFKDVTPPLPPLDLKDSLNNLTIGLQWTIQNVPDLAGFIVYRSSKIKGPFEKLNSNLLPIAVNQFTDKVEEPGPLYYYVAAVDYAGNEAHSNTVFVQVNDIIPPGKPSNVVAKADTGSISLSWAPNKEGDLVGYLIYRSSVTDDNNKQVLINSLPIKETSFTDQLPRQAKNTFYYRVVAIDTAFNKSEPSEPAIARMPDVIAPEAPFLKNVEVKEGRVKLEWLANVDTDLKGYYVYRSSENDPEYKQVSPLLPITSNTYEEGITSGVIYYYRVKAVDSANNLSLASNMYAVIKHDSDKADVEVKNVKAKFRKLRKLLVLSWSVKSESKIKGCIVYRKEGDAPILMPVTGLLKENKFTDKEIKKGNKYIYQIRVYTSNGRIEKSEFIEVYY